MKRIIIFTLLVGMLLLTACSSEEQPAAPQQGNAFIGGTTGVEAQLEPLGFTEDSGVQSIYDTDNFPLDVVFRNKGEQNLEAGQLRARLLGPAQEEFENIPSWELTNAGAIEKISEFDPEGGEEIISFTPDQDAQYTGTVVGFTPITWNVEYDYDYKTHVIVNDVCFKGDPTDPKVCTLKEAKTFSVSAAPITVTTVAEDTAGRGVPILKIEVSNGASGNVAIIGQEFDNRFGQVAYTIDEPEKWECKSGGRENEARLRDGKATIICKLREALTESDLYTKSIKFTLDYTYRELVKEELQIKESAR